MDIVGVNIPEDNHDNLYDVHFDFEISDDEDDEFDEGAIPYDSFDDTDLEGDFDSMIHESELHSPVLAASPISSSIAMSHHMGGGKLNVN